VLLLLLLPVTGITAPWLSFSASQLRARNDLQLRVDLPVTEQALCSVATQWSVATQVPVGVECLWEIRQHDAAATADRFKRSLDFSGLGAVEALELIVSQVPGYTVRVDEGFAVVRRKVADEHAAAVLDQSVSRFSLSKEVDLQSALQSVYQLLNPSHKLLKRPGTEGPAAEHPDRPSSPQATQNVDLSNTTIEAILTAICRAYGGLSWRLAYLTPERRPGDVLIQVVGSKFSSTAGPRSVR
jgi:hypothetical protein